MAYKVIILYRLYMPSYFLGTFTEYPCKDGKKKYKSLGVSVNPKFWNFEKNVLKPNCPN